VPATSFRVHRNGLPGQAKLHACAGRRPDTEKGRVVRTQLGPEWQGVVEILAHVVVHVVNTFLSLNTELGFRR
jgi:hypothetical protein